MTDQCAVGADGNLKDASEIVWHNDPDDKCPLPAPGRTTEKSTAPVHHFFTGAQSWSKRKAVDSGPGTSRRVARKVIPASSASSDDAGNLDGEDDAECTEDGAAEDGAEALYAQTKAMGDADREAGKTRLKSERTADVRTIFVKKDDGSESGHVCTIYEKNGVPAHHCFFKGGMSTLRTHIAKRVPHPNHFAVYQACCKNLQIPMHARACPKPDGTLQSQGSLDGIVVHQPRAPVFTTSGLLDYIVELVVCEDKAFQLDIPHRKALCEEIIKKAKATEVRVKEILKDIPGKVSFTFDAWTSDPGDPFLSVTGHYIHAPPERPNAWKL
ncbi:uncharacterized protein F5891DRAFT_1196785 [Suillus fuscotomentosus]|uniref:Uncharacterized protein n=1 Tax=Suillus fuscotomentosus TaxID=1912939 RepID=A0AAD4HEF5_9AGAM|nr:uncharacterized protein F5891DRAFT_1196785 [Suillus fuscotomentosus]KAG1893156.1 hypothetical protein F5891DRAFT_1196785 [Suillus fuscotomentosus]